MIDLRIPDHIIEFSVLTNRQSSVFFNFDLQHCVNKNINFKSWQKKMVLTANYIFHIELKFDIIQ